MTGTIFDIKEMSVHDGPGIRTTGFFKGCPLRCAWCHNPEGLIASPQLSFKENKCLGCKLCYKECNHIECKPFGRCIHICPNNCLEVSGKMVTAKELSYELKKSAEVLGNDFGGFTFSGGEPLSQPQFLLSLIDKLKQYHLCIETSGYADSNIFSEIISKLDFVIMDIKIADSALHKKYTGVSNRNIIDNLNILKDSGKPYIIRTPLIPDVTDTNENLAQIGDIIGESKWEKLPYNAAAGSKYKLFGLKYPLDKKT